MTNQAAEGDRFVIGYLQEPIIRPGDVVDLKVSTTAPSFDYELVRLRYDLTATGELVLAAEPVPELAVANVPGRNQPTRIGSYAQAPLLEQSASRAAFAVQVLIQPTIPDCGHPQVVAEIADPTSRVAASLQIRSGGVLCWTVATQDGSVERVSTALRLSARRWYRIRAFADVVAGRLELTVTDVDEARRTETAQHMFGTSTGLAWSMLRLAAATESDDAGYACTGFFNGKIEAPALYLFSGGGKSAASQTELVAAWDFAQEAAGSRLIDTGPRGLHCELINAPTRAVTGHNWTGEVLAHHMAPEQYGAVHFHDDDLDDARWQTDATIELPRDLPSGMYAVRLVAGDLEDLVPCFVGPAERPSTARLAFLVPTFAYLAYANVDLTAQRDYHATGLTGRPVQRSWRETFLGAHPELGRSLYARHNDGSGVCYSTIRRPILTMRPDYISPLSGGPRMLAADLITTSFLGRAGLAFDVLTDHELHRDGDVALRGYDVVLTGSHPEYVSGRMLDTLTSFVGGGGGLLYLGGNGFYWVSSTDTRDGALLEVRRGPAGARTWEIEPGEGYHSTTGEPGGLWRHRGRAPNRLTGVGFTSQGIDMCAPGYSVTPEGRSAETAFIFAGVDVDEPVGEYGFVMGGAAGYEIDRADVLLGTPDEAIVVATSAGRHSDFYQLCPEEVLETSDMLGGTHDLRVRSDMTYFRTAAGGSVFSVGSICFSGSLAHNDFKNGCAAITLNVINEFLRRSTENRAEAA